VMNYQCVSCSANMLWGVSSDKKKQFCFDQ
jgi:hypothetical protein